MKTQSVNLFRSFLPVLMLLAQPILPAFTQETANVLESASEITKTQYIVLDESSKKYRSFLGSQSGEISFKLVEIKNLTSDEFIMGVEINIQAQEREQVSSSFALGSFGSLWGSSGGATFRNIERSGHIFLDENDLDRVLDFLDSIIGDTGQQQDRFTAYSISIRERFEFGMVYDPESRNENKWSFTFTADNSTYNLDYLDGISTIKDLSRFREHIRNNKPE